MDPNRTARTDIGWNRPAAPRMGFLVGAIVVALVVGVLALGGGSYVIALDMADTTDDWHGLGIVLGSLLAVPGLLVVVLAALALVFRRTAPRRTRILGFVLGALFLVIAVLGGGSLMASSITSLTGLLLGLLGASLVASAALVKE